MKKLIPTITASLLLASCLPESSKVDPIGYWSDSTGIALFQVQKNTDQSYVISSTLGSLQGGLQGNSIRGVTDLKDSFYMEMHGDSAIYSVLGVIIPYHRINKTQFDSLAKIQ